MKIKYIIPLLLVLFTFACKNDLTIFEKINEETKLEKPDITGSVNSITQFKEKLYASDGNIYSKNINDVRDWSKISGPSGSIIKLAANTTYLYALNSNKELYTTTDGTTWIPVDVSGTISSIETIFDDGRDAAYIYGTAKNASAKSYFELDGTNPPSNAEDTITSTVVLEYNGVTYTASKNGTDGTVTDSAGGQVSDLGTIYSITYSTVDKAIYAGTSKGLRKLPVDDAGKLTGENQDPPENHDATIKTFQAFAVMVTGTDASNSALYTSTIAEGSTYAKINGLWGYYYNRRDTWNRE